MARKTAHGNISFLMTNTDANGKASYLAQVQDTNEGPRRFRISGKQGEALYPTFLTAYASGLRVTVRVDGEFETHPAENSVAWVVLANYNYWG